MNKSTWTNKWMSERDYEWANEIMNDKIRLWMNDEWMSEWESERTKRANYCMSKWMFVWKEWVNTEWINGWMKEWMTNRCLSEYMNGWMNEWMNEWKTNGIFSDPMNCWMVEWTINGWMAEWTMNEWMNKWTMNGNGCVPGAAAWRAGWCWSPRPSSPPGTAYI